MRLQFYHFRSINSAFSPDRCNRGITPKPRVYIDKRKGYPNAESRRNFVQKEKAPQDHISPGRLGSPPPELPNHEMDTKFGFAFV
jgi:hypothetical protein